MTLHQLSEGRVRLVVLTYLLVSLWSNALPFTANKPLVTPITRRSKAKDASTELLNAIKSKDIVKARAAMIRVKKTGKRVRPFVARITNLADHLYDQGKYKEATEWFRLAAGEGGASAQVSLGIILLEEKSTGQSDEEALKWFRVAEKRNDPWAFGSLAKMYKEGRGGLPKSQEKANEYYELAFIGGVHTRDDDNSETKSPGDVTSIHDAVRNQDAEAVRRFKDIESFDNEGNTPLSFAVEAGKLEMVQLLLSMGAKPNSMNSKGETPLLLAADLDDPRITEVLLKAGADPNLADKESRLPLHAALVHGRSEIVQMLLQAKADVNKPGIGGMNAAHLAVLGLYPEGLRSLQEMVFSEILGGRREAPSGGVERLTSVVDAGANIEAAGQDDMTPLILAISLAGKAQQLKAGEARELLRAIDLLIARGANINVLAEGHNSPLMAAATDGCNSCINMLVKRGAHVNDRDDQGRTALTLAIRGRVVFSSAINIRGRDLEPIKALAAAGSDLLVEDVYGLSPISYALWELPDRAASREETQLVLNELLAVKPQRAEVDQHIARERLRMDLFKATGSGDSINARALIDQGVPTDSKSPEGLTPLFFAIQAGNLELVRLLLSKGANPAVTSEQGVTPLMLAAKQCRQDIVAALLAAKADAKIVDAQGRTALHLAIPPGKDPDARLRAMENRDDHFVESIASVYRLPGVKPLQIRTDMRFVETDAGLRCGEVIDTLVGAGADISAKDQTKTNPLQLACAAREWGIVRSLLHGTPPSDATGCALMSLVAIGTPQDVAAAVATWQAAKAIDDEAAAAALVLAIKLNRADMLSILLRAGLNPNVRNADGETPLSLAIQSRNVQVMRELLSRGADPNQQAKYGSEFSHDEEGASLHILLDRESYDLMSDTDNKSDPNKLEIAKALLEKGANVNLFSVTGKTPLMMAVNTLDIPMVRLLLHAGADVTAKDEDKSTALGQAMAADIEDPGARAKQLSLVKLLLDEGDNVDSSNGFSRETPLTVAADRNDIEMFYLLLNAGANVNAASRDGRTPLIAASEAGSLPIVRILLKRRAQLEDESDGQVPGTALMRAIAVATSDEGNEGNIRVALELIRAGANVSYRNSSGRTPLHLVAIHGNLALCEALLKAGAKVTGGSEGREMPHFFAAEGGYDKILSRLLDKGAPLDERDSEGNTPLFYLAGEAPTFNLKVYSTMDARYRAEMEADAKSVFERYVRSVRLLVSRGLPINAENKKKQTALHVAAKHGNDQLVTLLIEQGASVLVRDTEGRTPLLHAVLGSKYDSEQRVTLIRTLIKHGAEVNGYDSEGTTALMIAAAKGDSQIMEVLLDLGADPNIQSETGETALHRALNSEDEQGPKKQAKTVELLLKRGANAEVASKDGNTPLMLAVFSGGLESIQPLIKAGANVNAQNTTGFTALMFAAAQGRADIIQTLLRAGANPQLKNKEGLDASSLAQKNGHPEITQLLIGGR